MDKQIGAVAFDVLGTLFALESLRVPLAGTGLPPTQLETWFAQTLRDAFALEITGKFKPMREVAGGTLKGLLARHGLKPGEDKIEHVLDSFSELAPHPNARTGMARLHEADIPILALSNGGAESTRKLLQRAELEPMVARVVTIEEVQHWKPHRAVYLHAAESRGLEPGKLALVSAHPWDILGAAQAGLRTAYVTRGRPFPAAMPQPEFQADTLADLASALVSANS